ncbi:hypothetical protein AB0M11_34785 [Streptomyces sp. NPDC051987]
MLDDMVGQSQGREIPVEPFLHRDVGVADRPVQGGGDLRGQGGDVV